MSKNAADVAKFWILAIDFLYVKSATTKAREDSLLVAVGLTGAERESSIEGIPMKNKSMLPYLIMILPPLFWAGNFIIGRAISYHGAPIGLSFWRWFLATLIILPFVAKPV